MVGELGDGFVRLSAGPLALALRPDTGGSIAAFDYCGGDEPFAILRDGTDAPGDVLAAASFPLVPFVNRIRDGQFDFGSRTIRLAPNMAGDPSPLHGQGWLAPWQVISAGESEAALRFEHAAGEWPWSYVADQHFRLTPGELELSLSCTNRSGDPMPCGLGLHPYFRCGPATRIETDVADVWLIDEHVLPTEMVPATGRYDLSGANVCGLGLDNGFGGWAGTARISDPAWPVELVMSSAEASFFQLYSPPAGKIFVAEPVTHANAALNAGGEQWSKLGIKILAPGQSMSLTMRLSVRPISG